MLCKTTTRSHLGGLLLGRVLLVHVALRLGLLRVLRHSGLVMMVHGGVTAAHHSVGSSAAGSAHAEAHAGAACAHAHDYDGHDDKNSARAQRCTIRGKKVVAWSAKLFATHLSLQYIARK
jgi:hypothetical protein